VPVSRACHGQLGLLAYRPWLIMLEFNLQATSTTADPIKDHCYHTETMAEQSVVYYMFSLLHRQMPQ